MKPALKITLIALSALLAAIVISASILIWIVFTPAKLTPIVRDQAANFLKCQTEISNVDLTFFSTFPSFGLRIDKLSLINPTYGALSDTLLMANTISASIDIKEFLYKNRIILIDVGFKNAQINIFTNVDGTTNYDVFISESEDSSAFKNPYDLIKVENLTLLNTNLHYLDLKSKMEANIKNLDANMDFNMLANQLTANLKLQTPDIELSMDTVQYLKNDELKFSIPINFDLASGDLKLEKSTLNLNNFIATIVGNINMNPENKDISTDIQFNTESYSLKKLLSFIPKNYSSSLEVIETDGLLITKGTVKGIFNDSIMPIININADLENGDFAYSDMPMKLKETMMNADILLNLNNDSLSNIVINSFSTITGESKLQANGCVDYFMLDDMKLDLNLDFNFNLPDLEQFMPSDMNIQLAGNAVGNLKMIFMLSDASNMHFDKMNITSQFDATNLRLQYDSLSLYANNSNFKLKIPNKSNRVQNFMNLEVWSNQLKAQSGKNTNANLQNLNLHTETSNITETEKLNKMLFDFKFDHMTSNMDDIHAFLEKSKGLAQIKMNFSDTVSMPDVDCDFDVAAFKMNMDTINADIKYPKGKLQMSTNIDKNLVYNIQYTSQSTNANYGSQAFVAQQMDVTSNIVYDEKAKSTFLQWVPKGNINMTEARIKTDALQADIYFPQIEFSFTPEEYIIKKGKLFIDNSDFELTGKLWNVNKYLRDEGLLMGEFDFKSNTTDIHRLMELTSGLGNEEPVEVIEETANNKSNASELKNTETSSGPYMVPKGMDLKLNAHIKEALLGFDKATDIYGNIFVKDGILALEDMRFNTSAANMQLSAMYKTPRTNHLFIAFDYHILNMEISELLKMIPDIDTIMPMLRSFDGKGEFHIAAETYTDSMYNLKKSTLRGVSSIKGENLTLMDGETFSEIAKKLRFNKKTENKIDSLSAEFTVFRNEVDIYPFLIVMDKYKAVVSGKHNLDMNFDYHISVTDSPLPFRLGVDVKGNLDDMKFIPAKCKYANLYRPSERREVDNKQLEIRKKIRDALTNKVVE